MSDKDFALIMVRHWADRHAELCRQSNDGEPIPDWWIKIVRKRRSYWANRLWYTIWD